jgi:phage shock protein A
MSEESRENILIRMGELQGHIKGHEKRLDQQHADINEMRRDIADLKVALSDFRTYMTQCFAEQNKLLVEKIETLVMHKVSPASALREFIETRPGTTAGISSALGVVAYCLGVMAGILPPPK